MFKTKLIVSLGCLLVCFTNTLLCQDVHYSQRYLGDQQINPAFTSNYEGNWQAASVYRQQWRSIGVPFTSSTIFFTKKFFTPIPALKIIGGATITSDKSGDAILSGTLFNLNLGAEFNYQSNLFSLVVQNGFVSKSFDENGLTFPEQYDRNIGGFNSDLESGESFTSNRVGYHDLNLGLIWKRKLTSSWSFVSGFSLNHLTQPTESFYDANNSKNQGYGVQVLTEKILNEKLVLKPYASYYRAQKARELLIGSAIGINNFLLGPIDNLSPFIYFRTGINRISDAIIIGSRADLGNFNLGLSYDVNISELELASNYKGGFEISLVYTAPYRKLLQQRIPCERY